MEQELRANEISEEVTAKDLPTERPRALTHDERKAAEAAFRGEPFNPTWSVAAARVYAGIQLALEQKDAAELADLETSQECVAGR